jgi:diphosphomevalonate decarboxylase
VKYKEKYLKASAKLQLLEAFEGNQHVAWRSPSNIALIKYWGKKTGQIPINPSLSFGLDASYTETQIEYKYLAGDKFKLWFTFDGKENSSFAVRIADYLNHLASYLPFINNLELKIESTNSFPHSSGIASSASAMSAMALCLCSIENDLFGTLDDQHEFNTKASFLARLGSGSAARSIYEGYTLWGKSPQEAESSNEVAIPYNHQINEKFKKLRDSILITSSRKKSVSSSTGHVLMDDHPYLCARISQAKENLQHLDEALKNGKESDFIAIIENEALSLHGLMMSSNPGYNLLTDNTWEIIQRIRQYRQKKGVFITFTLDAGPNVHVIYMEKDKNEIQDLIRNELVEFCENGNWIDDKMGTGPRKLK